MRYEQSAVRALESSIAGSYPRTGWVSDLRRNSSYKSRLVIVAIIVSLIALFALHATAQEYTPPPPPPPPAAAPATPAPPPATALTQAQLDHLVARIALYPDPLLAQIFAASSYWEQIPEASAWANRHSYLTGNALADAIREDNLQWDPSVLALLPFPSVLSMMAQDPTWIAQLGNAVLADRASVMDAVQRLRHEAYQYHYLQPTPYYNVVDSAGELEILPVNPAYIYVPTYNPLLVFAAPAPGFFVGSAIRFGPAIIIGPAFAPFGWVHPYFGWRAHTIFFDRTPWVRGWENRGYYVHPYAHPYVRRPEPRVEHHEPGRR
ncbi:MAG TPA: DUF3300 domain-containing protein [Terriglobales bacterium]|nr:DUF3300 domain-containing protein [Terriglobales bacterium]